MKINLRGTTAQQARAEQVRSFEYIVSVLRTAGKITHRMYGKTMLKRAFVRYCERGVRANRRAIRRNAS